MAILSGPAAAQQPLALEPVVAGLNSPVQVTFAPGDDASRLFVVTQFGNIRVLVDDALLPTAFLDIHSKLIFNGEQGLLGLAFHPDYAQNGYFYVNYTDNSGGDTVIERYSVDPNNPDLALPGSALKIIEIDQPFSNHNGGWIAFGPDGYLYVAMGDGGSGGDPGNRAQSGGELLGKMLRLDVDNPSGGLNYGIPPSNPFVNDPNVLDEIWALGLRNPWRNDFDNLTGDLWIADVGQGTWEEINFEAAGSGGNNYGWRIMEGAHCYNPSSGCNQTGLVLPIQEYSHGGSPFRCSISGGAIYRGSLMADMAARYFYSDYCSGQTWSFRNQGGAVADFAEHTNELLTPQGSTLASLVAFGEDADGEVYIISQSPDVIYRIIPDGLRVRPTTLTAGTSASVEVTDGTANRMIGLFYSRTGLGSTVVPQANVTLGIGNGKLLAALTTDGAGAATFTGQVPPMLQNSTIWLQAIQSGKTSNIAVEVVQ
jgi:glucose/arabinose dehydrogenase